ncbi:MAG: FtsX-like permease family protein [Anaerolineae bacterium]
MTRPRWHKVFADILHHKIRSLLVIASIGVGLFAIGMITRTYVILSEDIRDGYVQVHAANLQVSGGPFDKAFVDHIGRLPNVAQAQGAWNTVLRVRTTSGDWQPIVIRALSNDDLVSQPVNTLVLRDGEWPPDEHEIVVEFSKLSDTGARVGDELEIKLPSGTIRRMRLIGTVSDQTVGSSGGEGGFFLAGIQGYVTTDALAWLEQPPLYNTLYVTLSDGGEDSAAIHALGEVILAAFERQGYATSGIVERLSSEHPNVTYLDAMVAVIFMLGFMVVFLSGFLITNTLSALLDQQMEQIGVMKTVGASRTQIIGIYVVLILLFSAIALGLAIPLSMRASLTLLRFLADAMNLSFQGLRPVPSATLLQAAVALVVPLLAGSAPILRGTRTSIREALAGATTTGSGDTGVVFRLLARFRGVSRPLLISLRNTFRQRGRLALTLLTLTLAGATFIATLNLSNSLEAYIERLGRYFLADVNVTFSQPYRTARVMRDVLAVPGVEVVEGWHGALAQVVLPDGTAGESVQLVAPPAESTLIEPMLLEGRWIQPGDQNAIVLGELFRERFPDTGVGDTLRLQVGGRKTDWVVVGYFQFAGRSAGLFAYADYEYVAKRTGAYGSSASYRVVGADGPLDLARQEELAKRVEARLTALGYDISQVRAGLSLEEATSKGLNILTTFLLIMSFLMALVGSIGLAGTMSLNVMERTREIGVMRAIGGSNRAIVTIVLVEGCLIGLISWLLAGLVALPISKQLGDVMFGIIFDRSAALDFTLYGNLIWLGVVLALSVVASVIPAYNASRLTIREVLAYE